MNSPGKEDIDKALNGPMNVFESDRILYDAYKEAIDVLQDVLACVPYNTDERIGYYTIQVDKPDWKRAMDIMDKYPGE